jgi:hypothetical protein
MPQFSRGDQYGIDQLLNLAIPSLGLVKYFTYEVDWSLNLVDMVGLLALDHEHRGYNVVCCCNV